jgi:hypothetical protein
VTTVAVNASQVFSNPIVVMTFVGLIVNVILTFTDSKLPDLLLTILTSFGVSPRAPACGPSMKLL